MATEHARSDSSGLTSPSPLAPASLARREGLGAARGLVNGIVFALGLWLALTGLVVLLLR